MAAFIKVLSLTTLFMLLGFSIAQPTTEFQSRLTRGQQAMVDKGYQDMADMLNHIQSDLEIIDSENKAYTVFAPSSASFWGTFEFDPPLSIIRYHVVPFKVDKVFLELSSMSPQNIETLLKGHPIVVKTGQPHSLNQAFVDEWDIYNDGRFIVHGISDFLYPWFNETEAPSISPTSSPTSTTSRSSYFGENGSYKLTSLMFLIPLVFFRFLLVGFKNLV